MPDPAWPSLPPELNHLRLVGAGAGGTATTLASGAAWQAVTASSETSCSVSASNTVCTAFGFEGVGGTASAVLATGRNGALHLLAAWAQEKTGVAAAAVSAYETAISSMIPAAVSIANRTEQTADVAMNPAVFGALTPAIIALDTIYFGEHWPHNAAVGASYGAALAALTAALAIPPPLLEGASAAGPASAAEAASQTAAQLAAGESSKVRSVGNRTGMPSETVAEALVRPVSELAAPAGAMGGSLQPGMFQAPLQSLSGLANGSDLLDQTEALEAASVPPIAAPPALAAVVPSGAASTGVGQVGAPATAGLGAGLTPTTYAKPATAFPAESGGRPLGLKPGEPAATRHQGPATAGVGIAPMPVARDRSQSDMTGVAHARVLLNAEQHSETPD